MPDDSQLSAVEAFVLLKPTAASGRDGLKLAMMTLIAQGTVSIETEERRVLGFRRRLTNLRLRGSRRVLFPGARRLIDMVGPGGCTMQEFVGRVRRTYGTNLRGFVRQEVGPALIRRGLLVDRQRRVLWVFTRTRWELTRAGEQERARVESALVLARKIPEFLDNDPAQAAAIVFSLGTAVLLVPQLKGHYQQLAQALRDNTGNGSSGDGGSGTFLGGSDNTDRNRPTADDFQALSLADFDADAFDAFDSGLDAFDAGFDGAAGGDGGNGGNGGNGGGNGGC